MGVAVAVAVGCRSRGGGRRTGASVGRRRADLRVAGEEVRREWHALHLVAQQPDLGDRASRLGELGGLRGGALLGGEPCGLAQRRDHRQVAGAGGGGGRRPGGLASGHGGGTALHLGLGAVGPARAEAVALALEDRAAHQVAGQGADRRTARDRLLRARRHDPVDLALVRRGQSAVARGQWRVPVRSGGSLDRALVAATSARDERQQGEHQGQGSETDPAGARHGEDLTTSGVTSTPLSTTVTGTSSRGGYEGISRPDCDLRSPPLRSVERMTRFELATSTMGRVSRGARPSRDCDLRSPSLRSVERRYFGGRFRAASVCLASLVFPRSSASRKDSERMTRFELATSTLGRSRSTN